MTEKCLKIQSSWRSWKETKLVFSTLLYVLGEEQLIFTNLLCIFF